ncbi:unnamed protein product, partial [Arabidopsis halleri]
MVCESYLPPESSAGFTVKKSANGVKTNRRLAMEKKDSLKDGPISCS